MSILLVEGILLTCAKVGGLVEVPKTALISSRTRCWTSGYWAKTLISHARDVAVVSCPAIKNVHKFGMIDSLGKFFCSSEASMIKSRIAFEPSGVVTPCLRSISFCSYDVLKES